MLRQHLAVAVMLACVIAATPSFARRHHQPILDANGSPGVVVSHKTGATAHVSASAAPRFQAYVDALEAHGAVIKFMGGYRRGHCSSSSMHPCGRALDICQTGRGRVSASCRLPAPQVVVQIASSMGLQEGAAWCHSDYGHVQTQVTAAPCGSRGTMVASARSHRSRRQVAEYADPVFPSDRLTTVH